MYILSMHINVLISLYSYFKKVDDQVTHLSWKRVRCGRDRMVVGFTITCPISAYHLKL